MVTGISVLCDVSKGTFGSEYFVKINTLDGSTWEGVVDKETIFDLQGDPTHEKCVTGRMYSYLISFDAKAALIELPTEYSTSGRRIVVPLDYVRKERVPV